MLPDKPANSISHTLTPTASLPSLPAFDHHLTSSRYSRQVHLWSEIVHWLCTPRTKAYLHISTTHRLLTVACTAPGRLPLLPFSPFARLFLSSLALPPLSSLPLSFSSGSLCSSTFAIASSVRWQHLRQMWWGCITGWARRSERGHLV